VCSALEDFNDGLRYRAGLRGRVRLRDARYVQHNILVKQKGLLQVSRNFYTITNVGFYKLLEIELYVRSVKLVK
jgi:hypothetical protein